MHQFLVENSIFVVLLVVLIIWAGVSAFLLNIDKKLTKIENNIESKGFDNE